MPPGAPLLASVVRRGGGLSLSWGARLACLTRRGRPWKSALAPGSEEGGPAGPLGPLEPAEPGAAGSGPVSRDSSHGGPDAWPGRGEATGVIGVIGVAGPAGPPGLTGPAGAPGGLCSVQPGNGAGWSGYGAPPAGKDDGPGPANGDEPAAGYGGDAM
jgi:hypothetical protein